MVREIENDSHFYSELRAAGDRLVVANFSANGCGPCVRIAPHFAQLSSKYGAKAVFLKVEVNKCRETAAAQQARITPTFVLYQNKAETDRMVGADLNSLEAKIRKYVQVESFSGQGHTLGRPSTTNASGGHMLGRVTAAHSSAGYKLGGATSGSGSGGSLGRPATDRFSATDWLETRALINSGIFSGPGSLYERPRRTDFSRTDSCEDRAMDDHEAFSYEDNSYRRPAAAYSSGSHLLGRATAAHSSGSYKLGRPASAINASRNTFGRVNQMLHANAARAKTSIQIRLADGDRLTGRFDLTDTIADLRLFIISAKPKYAVRMFSLRTTFPNRELSDPNQSILSAGIENAVIIQSLH